MMSVGQMCTQDIEEDSSDLEMLIPRKPKGKRARSRKNSPAEDRDSSMNEDDFDDDDQSCRSDNGGSGGGNDHNRWYCNICKDGGELLCCDRCPRAFHTACLTMDPDDIPRPDNSWYCKFCTDTLERRKLKRDVKDKKRQKREEEKRLREIAREAKQKEKDDALARRSAKALEDKAKRVLDMKERIVKKQKVSYKDREEEKLGKIAENSAESIRQAKEKLEKLEKEDLVLKKKEQGLLKQKRNAEADEMEVGPIPEPIPCSFGGIPSNLFRQVLSAWDFVSSFQKIIEISPFTVEQLCSALTSSTSSPLINELHMCLLDLILESRERDAIVSEEDADMDSLDRYRFEVIHAPLTVGVPTSNMLNVLSWPAVLRNLITSVPRYFNNATPALKSAITAMSETEYPLLSIAHKLTLLSFLVTLAYSTEKVGKQINYHVHERSEAAKEHNRLIFQEKKEKAEENKRAQEQQKADKAKQAAEEKVAMQSWLKGGKNGAAPVVDQEETSRPSSPLQTDETSSTQSEEDDENSTDEDEEELKALQAKGIISRQEFLTRKKKIDAERDIRRKEKEERAKRTKAKEQILKKRAMLTEEIQLAIEMRDLERLKSSLKSARENGMDSVKKPRNVSGVHVVATPQDVKMYEFAVEFTDRLEAEMVREQELEERKQTFEKAMREYFIRTQTLGKDKSHSKYWLFREDTKRIYIEHSNGSWSYYDQIEQVEGLLAALGESNVLKKELSVHVDTIIKEMKKEIKKNSIEWENKIKKHLNDELNELIHIKLLIKNILKKEFIQMEENIWNEMIENGKIISDFIKIIILIEKKISGEDEIKIRMEEDEDEEEEDEIFVQNSLWPSKQARERWIGAVLQSKTFCNIALSIATLAQRLDILGLNDIKKETKPKREQKKQIEYEEDDDIQSETSPVKPRRQATLKSGVATEWEEYCCICRDGGELLCCDGCSHVFHYTCVGLRRIPRGKTFCPECDRSVKPVYPVVLPGGVKKEIIHIKSEEEWESICGICKKEGELLLCDGCPKAFHVDCLKLENFDPDDDWFCDDCENQSCGHCKRGRIRMDSHVICGNEAGTKGCEKVFHLKCVKLEHVPEDDWYCKRCLKTNK